MSLKINKTLTSCIAASLLLHLGALFLLQNHSIWFSSLQKNKSEAQGFALAEKKEKDEILRIAFQSQNSGDSYQPIPHQAIAEQLKPLHLQTPPPLSESLPLHSIPFQAPFLTQELLAANPVLPLFATASSPINLLDYIPRDLLAPPSSKPTPLLFFPLRHETNAELTAPIPQLKEMAPIASIDYSKGIASSLSDAPYLTQAPHLIEAPFLPRIPSLDELDTLSLADSFESDLVLLPREEGGYIFALTLIPRQDLNLPKMQQHFTFLIDRSNSIQQDRLNATKLAVRKALEELSEEDTFNIIAFDSKLEKMGPHLLSQTKETVEKAQHYLDQIQLGSFFSSSDVYKPLFLTVPSQVKNDEIYTAILLTDGESFSKKPAQRAVLNDWTQYNGGKVTLYALGLNGDAQSATLDAAASFNQGKRIESPTIRGLKRKLVKLMKTIQNPIAKNLSCKAISRSPHTQVRLFTTQSKILYLDQPFVLLGETEHLDDFILFVQGRLKNSWLNIKKNISFAGARKGTKSLKIEWAMQRAYGLYEQYTRDENLQHLAEANALLEPYNLQVAFQ